MEKRQRRGLLPVPVPVPVPVPGLLLTCFFWRYPLILWITASPSLSELIPLAAAERPSVASQ